MWPAVQGCGRGVRCIGGATGKRGAVEGDEFGHEFASGEDVHQGDVGGGDDVAGEEVPLPPGDGEDHDHGLGVAGDLEGGGAAFDDGEVCPADDGVGVSGADIDGGVGGAEVVADLPGAVFGWRGGDELRLWESGLISDMMRAWGACGCRFRRFDAAGEDGDLLVGKGRPRPPSKPGAALRPPGRPGSGGSSARGIAFGRYPPGYRT